MSEPHERLDAAMDARRLALGATWQDITAAAGVSDRTIRLVRNGKSRPTSLNARRLDGALGWAPGTVEAILDGTLTGEEPHLRGDVERARERKVSELEAEIGRLMGRLPAARRERIERMIREEEAELERLRVVALKRWRDLLESD